MDPAEGHEQSARNEESTRRGSEALGQEEVNHFCCPKTRTHRPIRKGGKSRITLYILRR